MRRHFPLVKLCPHKLDESFIEDKAEERGVGKDCDYFYYGGWKAILNGIMDGAIPKEDIQAWMAFFSDNGYHEYTIEEWVENNTDLLETYINDE